MANQPFPRLYSNVCMHFEKSTVVITGAGRGIGREISLAFARSTGHALLLLGRNEGRLQEVRDECLEARSSRLSDSAGSVETTVCDLRDSRQVDAFRLPAALPDPGVLVHNAGSFLLKTLAETSLEEFEEQWQVHARGPFQLTSRLLPRLHRQERGLIINICSLGGLQGQPESGAYSSSKHAMLGWSRSLRQELVGTSIAVTAIN